MYRLPEKKVNEASHQHLAGQRSHWVGKETKGARHSDPVGVSAPSAVMTHLEEVALGQSHVPDQLHKPHGTPVEDFWLRWVRHTADRLALGTIGRMAREAVPKNRPGPEAERLMLDMDWEQAVQKAPGRKKPAGGWPEPPPSGRKKRVHKPKKR